MQPGFDDREVDYSAIIAERKRRAAAQQRALLQRQGRLLEAVMTGEEWCATHEEDHPDYERNFARLVRLREREQQLYYVVAQFRFPFRRITILLPEGITWGSAMRQDITVVRDLWEHVPDPAAAGLEGLWLAEDARFLLAEAMGLL